MTHDPYRIAVVTGASRGIGRAVVTALAGRGMEVHAVARSAAALAELAAATGCRTHALDVADGAALAEAVGGLAVDVLVNNAGLAQGGGPLYDTPPDELEAMLRANVAGTVNALRAVVPGMVARDRGHVVNLGSIAATCPAPGSPAYAATKAAVHSLSRNLRLDLFGSRVRVTEIAPGRVRTGIHAGYVGGDMAKAEEAFYRGYECLEPEDIAGAVLFALDAPPRMDVTYMEILPTLQVYGGGDFLRTGPAADEGEPAATAAPKPGTRPAPRTRPPARRRLRR